MIFYSKNAFRRKTKIQRQNCQKIELIMILNKKTSAIANGSFFMSLRKGEINLPNQTKI